MSAPVALGTCAFTTAVNTCIITVTSTCAAGSAIWVAAGVRANSATNTGIADSQGNAWTFETEVSLPSVLYGSRSMHALNTAHTLTSGTDTITVTFSTASAVNKVAATHCIASAGGTFGTDTGTTATGSTVPVVIPSPSYALTADTIVSGIATVTATSFPSGLGRGTVVLTEASPSSLIGYYTLNAISTAGAFTATTTATGTWTSGGGVAGTSTTAHANAIGLMYSLQNGGSAWTYTSPGWTSMNQWRFSFVLVTQYNLNLATNGTSFGYNSTGCISSCPTTSDWAGQMVSFSMTKASQFLLWTVISYCLVVVFGMSVGIDPPALAWLPRSNGAGSSSGCPYAGYLDGCGGTYAPTIAGSYTTKITNFFTGYEGNYAQSRWCGTSGDPNSVACLNMTSDGVAGNPAPYSIPSWTTNTGTRFPGTGTPSEIAGGRSDQQTIPYGYGGTGGYGSTNPFASHSSSALERRVC